MTLVLRIDDLKSITHAEKVIGRIQRNLPEMTPKAMMRWGKILEKDMKVSARNANIKKFTGTLFGKGIRWKQRPRGKIGRLLIRNYGIALDSMKPHTVSISGRRTVFLKWAKQAYKTEISKNAGKVGKKIRSFPLKVKPHPFIRSGWKRARTKLRPIIKQETKKVMRGA